jgi:valyl-tRNA synthetase
MNMLKLLHPFIPFFSEYMWRDNKFDKFLKSDLITSNWPKPKKISSFNKSLNKIESLIEIITSIRSTKVQLNIQPKEYCNIIYFNESRKIKKIIENNLEIVKQVGRVNNIIQKTNSVTDIIQIVILNEKIGLQFETKIDLTSQKKRLINKQNEIDKKINTLISKLNNQNYIKKAPKHIVLNDKKLLNDLKIEQTKLKSIVTSII